MKNLLISVVLIFLTSFLLAEEPKLIGEVKKITGKAVVVYYPTDKKIPLKEGMKLYAGAAVKTSAQSTVLIVLSGGGLKYIPSDSHWLVMDKKIWELYQKSDATLKEFFVLVGIKAGIKGKREWEKKWQAAWEIGDFLVVFEMAKEKKSELRGSLMLYQAGMAALSIGQESEALFFFEKLREKGEWEFQEKALGGIFFAYFRQGKLRDAAKVLTRFKNRNRFYWKLRGLLEEAKEV